ncbi:hypothetical protein N7452_009816 [Penicillium brevicompactum]|uniref:Fe2OG dioxygenase domain-containing protein n=1 Tax=Penicillium brevicompactum TaxID=5074 RepID=A0A9W9Q935_PENBR|nr:hypothetical protein N7452_009816 [Penicillium brevicompactum]
MAVDTTSNKFAPLRKVNMQSLSQGNNREVQELVLAAKTDGMFYLDFSDYDSDPYNGVVNDMFSLSRSLFSLGFEDKLQYDIDTLTDQKTNGYKPMRRNLGGIPGQREGFESYTIPPSSILQLTEKPFSRPTLIDENWDTLHQFTTICRTSAGTILQAQSEALGLPAARGFETFHRQSESTMDIIRTLRYESADPVESSTMCIPQTAHTDLGSITLLFSNRPGLQLCPKGSDNWQYVEPQQNSAVVNLGDAIRIWSNGTFQSALHRVASLPNQGMAERYSFGYLMRPANHAPMCSLLDYSDEDSEKNIPSCQDWMQAKFVALRGKVQNGGNAILTGQPESLSTC